MELKKAIYDKLVEITQRNKPYEACAFLFDENTLVIEATPEERTCVSFDKIDPVEVSAMIDKYGVPSALFHSHPGKAFVSGKDEKYMYATMILWRCDWFIMSNKYNLRCWRIGYMDTNNFGKLNYREIKVEIIE